MQELSLMEVDEVSGGAFSSTAFYGANDCLVEPKATSPEMLIPRVYYSKD